jgi:predicted Zn finger-like uncharacterized protein
MPEDRLLTACPECGARLRVPGAAAGKRVRCPKCKQTFTVAPAAVGVAEPAMANAAGENQQSATGGFDDDLLAGLAQGTALESPDEQRARMEALAAQAARAGKRAKEPAAATEGSASASGGPGRARRALDFGGWLVRFGRGFSPFNYAGRVCLIMVVLGGALTAYGFKAARLNSRWYAQPKVIACADLGTKGSPDNAHVMLTDFVLLPNYLVFEKNRRWDGAWVPIAPGSAVEAAMARRLKTSVSNLHNVAEEKRAEAAEKLDSVDFSFQVIMSLPDAQSEADVDKLYEAEQLECTVISDFGIGELSSEHKARLSEKYPRTDFSSVRVVTFGGAPTSAATARLYQFGGVGLVLLAVFVSGIRAVG